MSELKVIPYFTQKLLKSGRKVETLFKWKKQDCEIRNSSGEIIFSMKAVRAPVDWSALAIEIAASKYFRRKHEKSVEEMVARVVSKIQQESLKQKYYKSKKEAQVFADELKFILLSQRAFFNSPVWFNCGLDLYGITASATQWAWDARTKKPVNEGEAFVRPQVSACFIQSVEDSLEGIFELAKTEARLFKYGSGSGTNFSTLRSKYESLDGGGKSSGLLAFLDVFDRGAGSVKSGGTTRRAAKMVCLDVDHPEILEFVEWKAHEEKKAQALIGAGYSADFEGEAYRTVSGQNSNNSVRVTDQFMRAVQENKSWKLRARTNGKTIREIPAQLIWKKIAESAWVSADPGLQYESAIQKWHTCSATAPIRSSNPCSEFMFLDDSACNLASLNLLKFTSENGSFDIEAFIHTTRVMLIAQEILVDLGGYPTEKICENSHNYRPLGVGLSGLGALLMRSGLPYDSDEGRAMGASLAALLTSVAYKTSAELSQLKGYFAGFKKNKGSMLKVLKKHQSSFKNIPAMQKNNIEIVNVAKKNWNEALALGSKSGFRNAQVSVMAPTGTIGLVIDAETTGVEPEFSLIKIKKMVGGSEKKIVSESFLLALKKLNYSQAEISSILDYVEVRGSVQGCEFIKNEHRDIFKCAMDISWLGHLKMMSALQPFVSGAISKTVNLPSSASVEDIQKIYEEAWRMGIKAIAIYRDGCKASQPLSSVRGLQNPDLNLPKCTECGASTELAGGCYRCVNCGTVIGCA